MDGQIVEKLINNLRARRIEGIYCQSIEEAKHKILEMIPQSASVGIGNSATLKQMDVSSVLSNRGNVIYDKTNAKTKEESKKMKKKALLADWYITGTNGLSMDGHLVNMDHSGNRVAAMIYGPERVIVVVGANKVVNTLEDAVYRVRNVASPKNARRAGFNPPCVEVNQCVDCKSDERVCNNLVIIEGQSDGERMKVLIINEEMGF